MSIYDLNFVAKRNRARKVGYGEATSPYDASVKRGPQPDCPCCRVTYSPEYSAKIALQIDAERMSAKSTKDAT